MFKSDQNAGLKYWENNNSKLYEQEKLCLNTNTNFVIGTFTMMNSHLITGYFVLANKEGTVSAPNGMQ